METMGLTIPQPKGWDYSEPISAQSNAESVRECQPRVALWQPWDGGSDYLATATLTGLRRSRLRIVFPPRISNPWAGTPKGGRCTP
jgi:hypothetical protein